MEPVTIGKQKFTRVKGIWVDQNKIPAPKDLIALLDKMSSSAAATQNFATAESQSKTPLPKLASAAGDEQKAKTTADKLENSLTKLTKAIEKLTKLVDKKPESTGASNNGAPAAKVYEEQRVPTLKEAIKMNTKDLLHGTKNKYGEVQERGLLRDLGSINPFKAIKYLGEDRRRGVIADNLRKYEDVVKSNNPNMSQAQVDKNIEAKRLELESGSPSKLKYNEKTGRWHDQDNKNRMAKESDVPDYMKAIKPSSDNSSGGEKDLNNTYVESQSKYASPDLDKTTVAVKITEIDDSVLDKLRDIFSKEDKPKEDKPEKKEAEAAAGKGGGGGNILDNIMDMFGGGKGGKRKGAKPTIEKRVDVRGREYHVDTKTGRRVQAPVAEVAESKPNIFSKIFGGAGKEAGAVAETAAKPNIMSKIFGGAGKEGAKLAEKEGIKTAEKVGLKALGKSALKKIPGVSVLAGGAFAAQRAMQGDWLGAAGELASGVAGTIPGLGTAASVGIDAALAARDMGAFGGVAGQTAEKVKPAVAAPSAKKPAGLMSTKSGKLLRGAALLGGVGFAGVGAKMLWDKMHKDPGAELSPPTVVTPQTQNLALTTKKVESAKDQRMAAPAPTITNITNSPSTVTNSQGIIGGPTVADRGSLNLSTF